MSDVSETKMFWHMVSCCFDSRMESVRGDDRRGKAVISQFLDSILVDCWSPAVRQSFKEAFLLECKRQRIS